MSQLANTDVSRIFTVPMESWTAINKRVGVVIAEAEAREFISTYLPGYPALLESSQKWERMTFWMLVRLSEKLAAYSSHATGNFQMLKRLVEHTEAGRLPIERLRETTRDYVAGLRQLTVLLANDFERTSGDLLHFLHDNQEVDRQIIAGKDKFGDFWAPVGEHIVKAEDATGLVTGCFKALADDLDNVSRASGEADLPFIESLKIDAAIVSWQIIQQESEVFAKNAAGQEKFWLNPFEAI